MRMQLSCSPSGTNSRRDLLSLSVRTRPSEANATPEMLANASQKSAEWVSGVVLRKKQLIGGTRGGSMSFVTEGEGRNHCFRRFVLYKGQRDYI